MNHPATPRNALHHTCVRVVDSNPELRIARVEDMHQFESFIDENTLLAGQFPTRATCWMLKSTSMGKLNAPRHAEP